MTPARLSLRASLEITPRPRRQYPVWFRWIGTMNRRRLKDGLLVLDIHSERSMITLRPVRKIAYLHPDETVQPTLGNKAVVDVEWLGLFESAEA